MNRDHFYVRYGAPPAPRVVEIDESGPNVPAGLHGKRLLFVTDVHMGDAREPERSADRLFAQIAALQPDMILWGGDYAEGRWHGDMLERMAALRPPLGAFAVIGNNDQRAYRDQRALFDRAEREAGLVTLVNRAARVGVDGGSALVIGIDEPMYGAPDLSLLRAPREMGEYRILLSHSPLALDAMPDDLAHRPDLILCGHTHGGQLSLFGLTPYSVGYERARGLKHFHVTGAHRECGGLMIVSNGIGCSLMPLRVGAPPEMHLVKFSRFYNRGFSRRMG